MKRNAYEESTIKKVAKLLRHLQRNCNTAEPEEVKMCIAKKNCSNGHKENLVEAYSIHMRSENKEWNQPFYQRYDKKLCLEPFRNIRSYESAENIPIAETKNFTHSFSVNCCQIVTKCDNISPSFEYGKGTAQT